MFPIAFSGVPLSGSYHCLQANPRETTKFQLACRERRSESFERKQFQGCGPPGSLPEEEKLLKESKDWWYLGTETDDPDERIAIYREHVPEMPEPYNAHRNVPAERIVQAYPAPPQAHG